MKSEGAADKAAAQTAASRDQGKNNHWKGENGYWQGSFSHLAKENAENLKNQASDKAEAFKNNAAETAENAKAKAYDSVPSGNSN
jgi:hypothetical protein